MSDKRTLMILTNYQTKKLAMAKHSNTVYGGNTAYILNLLNKIALNQAELRDLELKYYRITGDQLDKDQS